MSMEAIIDDKLAWKRLKEDENLKGNTFVFFGLTVLAIIPILNIITLPIISILTLGYFLNLAHIRIFKPDNPLPKWSDFGKLLGIGFKAIIVSIIIGLPVGIPINIAAQAAVSSGDITSIPTILLFATVAQCIVFIIYSIIVLAYITNFKIKSFFNIKAIKHIIKSDLFSAYIIKVSVCGILMSLAIFILPITIIGVFFIPMIMYRFLAVIADLQAQFIRYAFKIGQKHQ